MSIVVADTGPPHYLILIGETNLLPRLFEQVFIPDAVERELRHPRAPAMIRTWIDNRRPGFK